MSLCAMELFADDFSEQKFCERVTASDEIADEQAQTDDDASYGNSNNQFRDDTWVLCHESSDIMHIRENQDIMDKIDIQSSGPDILQKNTDAAIRYFYLVFAKKDKNCSDSNETCQSLKQCIYRVCPICEKPVFAERNLKNELQTNETDDDACDKLVLVQYFFDMPEKGSGKYSEEKENKKLEIWNSYYIAGNRVRPWAGRHDRIFGYTID